MSSPNYFRKSNATTPADPGTVFLTPHWETLLSQADLRTVDDFLSISGKALSKPGLGKRYRAQLELRDGSRTILVFYKRYAGESARSWLQRWVEDGVISPVACREVRVAHALEKIGIKTFEPLAWGWTRRGGLAQKSFLIMSQVPGSSTERWLENASLDWQKKLRLAQKVAEFAKRLHQNGWYHRDFYLCHIFIEERSGEFDLALVDLARMFRPRWRTRRWQIKDLAQLNYSAEAKYFSRSLRLYFAKAYFGCARFNSEQKQILRKIVLRTEQIRRRDLAKTAQQSKLSPQKN